MILEYNTSVNLNESNRNKLKHHKSPLKSDRNLQTAQAAQDQLQQVAKDLKVLRLSGQLVDRISNLNENNNRHQHQRGRVWRWRKLDTLVLIRERVLIIIKLQENRMW